MSAYLIFSGILIGAVCVYAVVYMLYKCGVNDEGWK